MSDADVEFRFRAFLYDKAGNVTQVPRPKKFVFDSSAGEYELFAVADPNSSTSVVPGISSGYIKYSAGMTVNTNPVTLVYKIPKHNYRAYNKAGLSFGSLLTEDNSYVYIKTIHPSWYIIYYS
uniref:Ig-like domain-containing protein n=1 Tax=Klebsiella pneumoniae TaxID=573 RepID=A0A8B0SV67_KLEPN|nr:hypothetical protein [Klebsiella pneumoniae]